MHITGPLSTPSRTESFPLCLLLLCLRSATLPSPLSLPLPLPCKIPNTHRIRVLFSLVCGLRCRAGDTATYYSAGRFANLQTCSPHTSSSLHIRPSTHFTIHRRASLVANNKVPIFYFCTLIIQLLFLELFINNISV
jgi:hypothetical protein